MHLKPGLFRMAVRVDQGYWNQGAGRLLYREAESWAREHSASRLQAEVREYHPEALAWAERRGFAVDPPMFESVLDLAGFDPTPFQGSLGAAEEAGFRFTTLAELGDHDTTLERLFEWVLEVAGDSLGQEGRPRPPFAWYRAKIRNNPKWSAERMFVALDGDRMVASAELMLAVNRKFGYKQEPGYFQVIKTLG